MDGELYLPEDWFTPEMEELREKLGIPAERRFETKIELGWEMIQRAHACGTTYQNLKILLSHMPRIERNIYGLLLYRNARENANMTLSK